MAHFKDDTINLQWIWIPSEKGYRQMSLNHVLSNENIRERLMSGLKKMYASEKQPEWDASKVDVMNFITELFKVDKHAQVTFRDQNGITKKIRAPVKHSGNVS